MVRLLAGLFMFASVVCAPPAMPAAAELAPVGPIPGPRPEAGATSNPATSEKATPAEGRRLFLQFNCYGCHGGRAGGGMGPSLRDPDWIYGNSPGNIYSSISEGRGKGMPAWGPRLPERQIWQLVAYIRSLGTDDEPARPRE